MYMIMAGVVEMTQHLRRGALGAAGGPGGQHGGGHGAGGAGGGGHGAGGGGHGAHGGGGGGGDALDTMDNDASFSVDLDESLTLDHAEAGQVGDWDDAALGARDLGVNVVGTSAPSHPGMWVVSRVPIRLSRDAVHLEHNNICNLGYSSRQVYCFSVAVT